MRASIIAVAALALSGARINVSGQPQSPAADGSNIVVGTYLSQRLPDGHPDLQGVWNYASGTPLERPEAFGGQEILTDDQFNRLEQQAHERGNADRRDAAGTDADVNRDAPEFWFERRKTILTTRTSLIVDPPRWEAPAGDQRGDDEKSGAPGISPGASRRFMGRPTGERPVPHVYAERASHASVPDGFSPGFSIPLPNFPKC